MTSNEIFVFIFLGYAICILHDVLLSLTNYLNEKAWRVRDYEEVIYSYLGSYDGKDAEEKEIIINAHINYEKRLQKRENLNKFLNKFRRNKKDV